MKVALLLFSLIIIAVAQLIALIYYQQFEWRFLANLWWVIVLLVIGVSALETLLHDKTRIFEFVNEVMYDLERSLQVFATISYFVIFIFFNVVTSMQIVAGYKNIFPSQIESVNKKIFDLDSLGSELTEKLNTVNVTQENLSKRYLETINMIKENKTTDSMQEAITNVEINQKMLILQKLVTYLDFVSSEKTMLQASLSEIGYMKNMTEIDILLISNNDSDKAVKLVDKMNVVIEKYRPQAENMVLPDDIANKKSLQEIWDNHIIGQ